MIFHGSRAFQPHLSRPDLFIKWLINTLVLTAPSCLCVWPSEGPFRHGKAAYTINAKTTELPLVFPQLSTGERWSAGGPESRMLTHVSCLIYLQKSLSLPESTWHRLSPTEEARPGQKGPRQEVSFTLAPGGPPTLSACLRTADRRAAGMSVSPRDQGPVHMSSKTWQRAVVPVRFSKMEAHVKKNRPSG